MISAFIQNAAFASNNILNSIFISSNNSTFNIKLNTSSSIKFKYSSDSSDKITIFIKNIQLSDNFNTIFEDALNINGVIIEPNGMNLKISINGNGISNSNVQNVSQTADGKLITYMVPNQGDLGKINLILCLLCIGLIFGILRKNTSQFNQIPEIAQEREFSLMKSIIDNFKTDSFVYRSNLQEKRSYLKYNKIQNTNKTMNNLEKQFSSDLNDKNTEEKFNYKTPARTKLGGMTNVCSAKIISPKMSELEKARVVNTIKTKPLGIMAKI